MEKSKVYFTDFRTKLGEGLPTKLKRLMKAAGIEQIDMENKFVAIKYTTLPLQHPVRHFQMMIHNFGFPDPFKCRHYLVLPKRKISFASLRIFV